MANSVAGVTSVNLAFSAFPGRAHAVLAEFSGVAKSGALLGHVFSNQAGSFKATQYTSGNLTIAAVPALLLGFTDSYYGAATYTWTAGPGFVIQNQSADSNMILQTKTAAVAGVYSSNGSMSPSGAIDASLVAFQLSGSVGGGGTPPIISSFSASPSSITLGASSTLSWAVSGATSLSIDQGIAQSREQLQRSSSQQPPLPTLLRLQTPPAPSPHK